MSFVADLFKSKKGLALYALKFLMIMVVVAGTLIGVSANNTAAVASGAANSFDILYLSTEDISKDSTQENIVGIEKALTENSIKYDLSFEFIDDYTSVDGVTQWEDDFLSFYEKKYEESDKYDLIFCAEDEALAFVLNYGEELFGDTPIVFTTVTSMDLINKAKERENITGVSYIMNLQYDFDLMKSLFPKRNKVIAVTNSSLTGKAIGDSIINYQKQNPDLTISVVDTENKTANAMVSWLKNIPDDTIILFCMYSRNADGDVFDTQSGITLFANNCPAPVFVVSDFAGRYGSFGGYRACFEKTAYNAALLGVDILNGFAVSDVPIVETVEGTPTFDYDQLQRFNIKRMSLPKGSVIYNDHLTIFEEYPALVSFVLVIIVLLFIIIAIMFRNQRRQSYIITHDNLTGLPNKVWSNRKMVDWIAAGHEFAQLSLSLNEFKKVNDKLGRDGGDIILKLLVDRITNYTESTKKLYMTRYGGDEFLILIDSSDPIYYEEVCKRICKELDKPFINDDGSINLSYSMCVVAYPKDGKNIMTLQQLADAGIKKVKNSERSGYFICDDKLLEAAEREKIILHKLNEAIVNDGFKLLYQAKYNVKDRTLYGFEALLRMVDGYAYPGEFIKVAEENRLMIPIGRQLSLIAVRQMANWRAAYKKLPVLSINFSTLQIYDEDYPEYLLGLLKKYDVPVENIMVEITESASLSEREEVKNYMKRFTDNGIKLSIDDFGTGYSSISYLNNMSFSELKLDKSLLDQYLVTRDDKMIATIITMAHNLGCHVVAEGVEVEDQAKMLEKVNGDIIQGYLLGKPEEPEIAEDRIAAAQ
ncbi:MAG: EAL domain-containing protein [Butyrivibrio sp.]|nr:EAL domain-containing protein [Butyrivibrio sp.]